MDKKDRVEPRNVSMYPDDWQTVEELAARLTISISAALRVIVRQWLAAQ
ncbi:MAG: ribbon-helix-helix protein, CopG family [Anaerolineae bacterium]|nr:ribbon-helix-helix protein, CopG family [Anaerolineae bacterium]